VAVNSNGDISAEPVRGQKIEEHVVTGLDLRNEENISSLTSNTVAEERQDVSSKNTIDKMADVITSLEVVDRSWLCFSPSQTCVKCFTCGLMFADTTKYAHFLIKKRYLRLEARSWASEESRAISGTYRYHDYI